MNVLKTLSFVFLSVLLLLLVIGNIFYSPIRHYLDKNYQWIGLTEDEESNLGEQNNSDYQLKVETDKKVYRKFEKIKLFARIIKKNNQVVPENAVIQVEFYSGIARIRNIDGNEKINLSYYSDQKAWIGYFFPESPEIEGKIDIVASGFIDSPEVPVNSKSSFVISEISPKFILNKGQAFMGIDSLERVSKRSILSVEGKEVDWNYIPEWVNFISADGIIMLSGITKTFQEDVTLDSPWDKDKLSESLTMADKIGKNKHFGVYARGLKVEGVDAKKIGYIPSLYFKGDGYGEDPAYISLLDENRKKSLIKLLTVFMDNENISYVGISDIFMPSNYGTELLEDYFRDCRISVPGNWGSLDFNGKFSIFKSRIKDPADQNRFSLWKLYFISGYIRDIVNETGHKKPLFYRLDYAELKENPLILSMLLSAGVDFVIVDFNMTYDKIPENLSVLSVNPDIARYMNRVIVSYYFDYQNVDINGFDKSAIENYVGANLQLLKNGSGTLIADGILINDLYKIMFGRRGPYTPNEWMLGVGEIVYELKQVYESAPLCVTINAARLDYKDNEALISFNIANTSSFKINNFKIEYLPEGGKFITKNNIIKEIQPGREVSLDVNLELDTNNSLFLRKKNFLGYRVSWDDPGEKSTGRSGFLFYEPVNPGQAAEDKKKGGTNSN